MFIGLRLLHSIHPSFVPSFYLHLLSEGSLVYGTQNASYVIYWLYVICSYLGVAASRQSRGGLYPACIPVLLSRAEALTILYLRSRNIPIILDGRNQSLHYNAKKLSSIHATGNIERVGEKHKSCKLEGKVLYA